MREHNDRETELEEDIKYAKDIEKSEMSTETKRVALGIRIQAERSLKREKKRNWINPNW